MKKVSIKGLIVVIILFSLSLSFALYLKISWETRDDTKQIIAKEEFSKYHNGINEVVLEHGDNFYFEDHILTEEDFRPNIKYGSAVFYEKSIYYLSYVTTNMNTKVEYINVYSCDIYGNNSKKIYSKELNSYKVDCIANKDNYYIKYKKDKLFYIDKYTISTGIYENIASGKDCNLYDYKQKEEQTRYNIEVISNKSPKEHGKFIITDSETGVTNIIDDDYLKNTIYIESMEMFNYGPERVDISNGHILLTYEIAADNGWNHPHLVFEYIFENNSLEYKLLAFPEETTFVNIIYIG